MAISSIGTRGTQTSSAAGTTIARAPSSAVAAGRILICQIAQNGNADISSVVDAQGNTWEPLGTGANGSNARSDVWMARIETALTTSNNVTVTFSSSITHKSMLLWEFSVDAGNTLIESATPVGNSTSATNGFGSVSFASLPSKERLYLRALAKQANITTAITATSGFTTQGLTIRTQNNAATIVQRGEFRINTSTGETSNPTLNNTGNTGNVFLALEEFTPPTHYLLETDPGNFSITGSDAELEFVPAGPQAFELIVNPTSLALSGSSATTLFKRRLDASPSSYAIAGADAQMRVAYRLSGTEGAFAVTGFPADLTQFSGPQYEPWDGDGAWDDGYWDEFRLRVTPGVMQITGESAQTLRTAQLHTTPGAYSISGSSAQTLATRRLETAAGSFAITGQDARTLWGRQLQTTAGAFALTGFDARTLKNLLLQTAPGSFAVTGASAQTLRGLAVLTTPGAFSVTGSAATSLWMRRLQTTAGVFSLTGASGELRVARRLQTLPGSLALSGAAATTLAQRRLEVTPAVLQITGVAARTLAARVSQTTPGAYSIAPQDVQALYARALQPDAGQFDIAGASAQALRDALLGTTPGAYEVQGFDAELLQNANPVLGTEVGVFAIAGFEVTLNYSAAAQTSGEYPLLRRRRRI